MQFLKGMMSIPNDNPNRLDGTGPYVYVRDFLVVECVGTTYVLCDYANRA